MKTYTLKSVARRGSLLGAAFVLAGASMFPAMNASADALNPLTERSLTLSSSSPGWSYLDAAGNPNYAPPNSGANGEKTGNTFSFRVSSTADVKGMSFQYCTTPAGNCMAPGNIPFVGVAGSATRASNHVDRYALQQSDLEAKYNGATEVSTFDTKFDAVTGQPATGAMPDPRNNTPFVHPNVPKADGTEGAFIVMTKPASGGNWVQSKGWAIATSENQIINGAAGNVADLTSTGKSNYITLVHTGVGVGDESLDIAAEDYVKVIFFGTDNHYITNPGDKEFFVKINTFSVNDPGNFNTDIEDPLATIIDGGVTVANVMNRSIEIQTKVLETMDFSVGTVDPVTLDSTDPDYVDESTNGPLLSQLTTATGLASHVPCAPIEQGMGGTSTLPPNVLQLGDVDGEFSLRTDTTYSTHSYWRLSSNSSGGATVYYSGVTLSNTVGDQIDAIGLTAKAPARGSEQFGLALDHETTGTRLVSYAKERDAEAGVAPALTGGIFQNGADNAVTGVHPTFTADMTAGSYTYHMPRLSPLSPRANYGAGAGAVNPDRYTGDATAFAFDPESTVIPAPFADGTEVLDCVTGKMRYIANIAATTPAGVYTTKINYIAAPKY